MMPLIYADAGEENTIRKISGNDELRQHLADLGFVAGANVRLLSSINGNVIVSIKNTRIALNADMARRIMI
ncbi:MAG: ferrous iron transport protein A [Erysipelotrichaceae bacterium]|nr:ferrous iron transport protein A [Erysipelotrichaceae bacterium]